MNINLRSPLSRRTLIKAGGISLALPFLNAMLPRSARGEAGHRAAAPRRLLLIGRNLGMHAPFLFPEKDGLDYESTRYLRLLEEHRGSFTVFSGMSHLRYANHHSEPGLFTGVDWDRIKEPAKEHHNSISLDQYAAEQIGHETRFRNLVLGSPVQWHFSWTAKGVPVPQERRPTEIFKKLFIDGSADEVTHHVQRLREGKSILDQVVSESKSMARTLGREDRERLERMFSSIRDAEHVLDRAKAWATKPKPRVGYQAPLNDPRPEEMVEREGLWLDLSRLAFQTDSTRVILLTLGDAGRAKLEGLALGHHDASHHGKDDSKIEQLALIEEAELKQFSRFLTSMKETPDSGETLFDRTAILNASNLGNASAHTCENLPVILAGGGFKHRGHKAHDRENNVPLSNLYVRMLQQLGVETESFGSSVKPYGEI
jgi:hypothetical protein